jgi:hypothetical protein
VQKLLFDAAEVLAYLHRRVPPVIHRDLKPGNVLKKKDGSFAFVDFGAVRDKLRADGGSTVVGTFGYMAPEQFQGRALPASDVYAIGATAITMLTGKEPEDLPHKGLGIDVRAATKGLASEALVAALEKMLEPDPDQRAAVIPRLEEPRATSRAHLEEPRAKSRDRKSAERGKREARKAAKEARRRARASSRASSGARASQGRVRLAWPMALLFSVGLALSEIGIVIALRVIVPLLLNVLSLAFARERLRAASQAVRAASDRAVGRVHDAHQWVQDAHESRPPEVRVDGAISEKERDAVRVADALEDDEAEDEDTDEADRPNAKKRRT